MTALDSPPMGEIRQVVGDSVGVVAHGLRLVLAHAPVLAVLFLLGSAGRHGFLWLAVEVSRDHSTVAGFILPLAPLSTLVAFISMLVVVSRSTDSLAVDPDAEASSRSAGWLAILASSLVPFLAVYAAQGYLKEDVQIYVNAATYDEIFGRADAFYGESGNADRTAIATGAALVAIVVLALVLRFLFDRFALPSRYRPLAFVAAYVEVLWIVTLGYSFTHYQDQLWEWVRGRVFVHWVQERWADLIDLLGPVGEPVSAVVSALGSFIDTADDVVLIPVAWLAVAAVVFGRSIQVPDRPRRAAPQRLAAVSRRTPPVVRRWAGELTSDFRGRFSGLQHGFKVLLLGGIVPMAMFCLVFIIARQAGVLVRELWRVVLGPQASNTGLAFAPWLQVTADLVEYVLLAGLLAAAISRIQGRQARLRQEDDERVAREEQSQAPIVTA